MSPGKLADGPSRTFASNVRLSQPRINLDFFWMESTCVHRGQRSEAEEVRRERTVSPADNVRGPADF